MAKIILNWTDVSNNGINFKVYRSTGSIISTADDEIISMDLDVGNAIWSASADNTLNVTNPVINSTNSGDPTNQEDFELEFEDSSVGEFYYGVSVSNDVGESDIVPITLPAII